MGGPQSKWSAPAPLSLGRNQPDAIRQGLCTHTLWISRNRLCCAIGASLPQKCLVALGVRCVAAYGNAPPPFPWGFAEDPTCNAIEEEVNAPQSTSKPPPALPPPAPFGGAIQLQPVQMPHGRGNTGLCPEEGRSSRLKRWPEGAPGPHAHRNTARQATDGLWTEARGRQKQSNDPGNNQHILNTPIIGRR